MTDEELEDLKCRVEAKRKRIAAQELQHKN